jgi:hypothetical protein
VLRKTSRGLCALVCSSRTSERGRKGDWVKEGGGEGERERERALGVRLQPTVYASTANLAGAPTRSRAPVSTEGRSGVGGSSDGQDEQSRIVLPPETGEQPSLSSGLSDAPWLNRRRPGSLYSILEYE